MEVNHINIQLLPQESPCNARFDSPLYMTQGFRCEFGDLAPVVAVTTLFKIQTERVQSEAGADYLQCADYKGKRFWVIDSLSYTTFLLPSEY